MFNKKQLEFIKLKNRNGFTLIELLVVISIVGILIALSVFGLQGARETSRDSKRKSDLQLIRSGLEIYRSDCNKYVAGSGDPFEVLDTGSGSLTGDDSISACGVNNTYISEIPQDPTYPNLHYLYYSDDDGVAYEICTSLEQVPTSGNVSCGSSSDCGGATCNYKVVNP